MNLYSSDFKPETANIGFFEHTYGKQLIWLAICLLIAFFIMQIDAVAFSMFSYILYIVVIGLLFLVLIIGAATHGAKSWFLIGSYKFQPVEFAKFATSLALAKFVSVNGFKFVFRNFVNIIVTFAIVFIPVILILLQPDVGSALVYFAFIFVLYREGFPGIFLFLILVLAIVFVSALLINQVLLLLIIIGLSSIFLYFALDQKNRIFTIIISFVSFFSVLYFLNVLFKLEYTLLKMLFVSSVVWTVFLFIYFIRKKNAQILIVTSFMLVSIIMQSVTDLAFNKILKPHQRNRIDVLFDNSIDPKGIGYNITQSKIAIGSGGFWGKGYLNGTQTKLNFVPEHNTDFIFCTIAEEWGFIGGFVLFLLFALLIIRIVMRAERQISVFSRIYGYSVASIFFIHFFVNVGMTLGLLPVIGIPLPFFSYGGSSMLGFTILLFIFIKLDTEKDLKL